MRGNDTLDFGTFAVVQRGQRMTFAKLIAGKRESISTWTDDQLLEFLVEARHYGFSVPSLNLKHLDMLLLEVCLEEFGTGVQTEMPISLKREIANSIVTHFERLLQPEAGAAA